MANQDFLALDTLVHSVVPSISTDTFLPDASTNDEAPKLTLNDLGQMLNRSYELTFSAAAQANIPAIGSVSGGYNRRVLVIERTAFKEFVKDDVTEEWGYAIRLAITVNKLDANLTTSLPFLAASAQIGKIEAKFMVQVAGLAGKKISEALLPPTELNVETFVLTKQSLEAIINAVYDQSTTFIPQRIGVRRELSSVESRLMESIGNAYAMGRIAKRVTSDRAIQDLDEPPSRIVDAIADTYRAFAGISMATETPSNEVANHARKLLDFGIRIEPK